MNVEFNLLCSEDSIPYEILLLADPSIKNIQRYLVDAIIYKANFQNQIIGCCVVQKMDHSTLEIKNIAIAPAYQKQGLGSQFLKFVLGHLKNLGFKKLVIGTGNSSIAQLYIYQKQGFRISKIIPDFFRNNYEETIFENGIECRDMIVLEKNYD